MSANPKHERARVAAHYYGQLLVLEPQTSVDDCRNHIAELYGAKSWTDLAAPLQAEAVRIMGLGGATARRA